VDQCFWLNIFSNKTPQWKLTTTGLGGCEACATCPSATGRGERDFAHALGSPADRFQNVAAQATRLCGHSICGGRFAGVAQDFEKFVTMHSRMAEACGR
jgi:hypothetical protein